MTQARVPGRKKQNVDRRMTNRKIIFCQRQKFCKFFFKKFQAATLFKYGKLRFTLLRRRRRRLLWGRSVYNRRILETATIRPSDAYMKYIRSDILFPTATRRL